MPLIHNVKFAINANSVPRVILTGLENQKGELLLMLKHAERFGHDGDANRPIRQQRYSVHPSRNSAEFSVIKQTVEEGGRLIPKYHVTDAIKGGNGFAPLFTKRCPNLAMDRYTIRDDRRSECVSLGGYDPRTFSLVYSLLVASRGRAFAGVPRSGNVLQYEFENCRVVILWTFLLGPSHHTGTLFHKLTTPPEHFQSAALREAARHRMRGKDEVACLEEFDLDRAMLQGEMLQIDLREGIERRRAERLRGSGTFPYSPRGFWPVPGLPR